MTEWWTYRLSDFLMFSARTYRRLFELYNTEVWPLPLVAFIVGVAALAIVWHRPRVPDIAVPVGPVMLAAAWLWIAWAFQLQRYATILTAAPWFAAAFAFEALILLAAAWIGAQTGASVALRRATRLRSRPVRVRGPRLSVDRRAARPAVVTSRGLRDRTRPDRDRHARCALADALGGEWRATSGRCNGLADTARLVRRQRRDLVHDGCARGAAAACPSRDRAGRGDQDARYKTRRLIRAGRPIDAARQRRAASVRQVRPPGVADDVRTIRGSSAFGLSRATRSVPPSATTRVPTAIDWAWWKTRLVPSSMRTRTS